VFTVKRYYRPEWGENWREHFTVDRINGFLGHELKYDNQKLVGNYLRVGFDPQGSWRIYKLRPDFHPAEKVQVEDDITASVVVPRHGLKDFDTKYPNRSAKLVENCEAFLFQRPDDAIHRGFDAQAEADIATPGTFLSNFEPLTKAQAKSMVDHVVEFDQYTEPMQALLRGFVSDAKVAYAVSSAYPRMVDGRPSKNPRYLQKRPDLVDPLGRYLAEVCARLDRGIPADQPVRFPVNAVLAGRRGNPADPKIGLPPLAVYNPIHYQELPELFMDFICSLTGKSPSTTGFGSEGALTKGPFNAVSPVVDLNNALVAAVLTEYAGFTTAAGYVGPQYRVDHDISMLAPEVWCRVRVPERDPRFLIDNGFLEKMTDFEWRGRTVLASRLGYRITALFAERFWGGFSRPPTPSFPRRYCGRRSRTWTRSRRAWMPSWRRRRGWRKTISMTEAWRRPVRRCGRCSHIMAHGEWEGKGIGDSRFRAMFTREAVLESDWYKQRLRAKQERDIALWSRHIAALEAFAGGPGSREFDVRSRLEEARAQMARVSAVAYLAELVGTIGADPFTDR
jgi:phosphoenolpyruvate carboxykinase (diphosphate)